MKSVQPEFVCENKWKQKQTCWAIVGGGGGTSLHVSEYLYAPLLISILLYHHLCTLIYINLHIRIITVSVHSVLSEDLVLWRIFKKCVSLLLTTVQKQLCPVWKFCKTCWIWFPEHSDYWWWVVVLQIWHGNQDTIVTFETFFKLKGTWFHKNQIKIQVWAWRLTHQRHLACFFFPQVQVTYFLTNLICLNIHNKI